MCIGIYTCIRTCIIYKMLGSFRGHFGATLRWFCGHFGVTLGTWGSLWITLEPFWGHSLSKLDQSSFKNSIATRFKRQILIFAEDFRYTMVALLALKVRRGGNQNGQRCDRNKYNAQTCSFWGHMRVQKVDLFNRKCLKPLCEIMLPVWAGSKILKKHRFQWTQNSPKTDPKLIKKGTKTKRRHQRLQNLRNCRCDACGCFWWRGSGG